MNAKKLLLFSVIILGAVLVLSGCKSATEKAIEKATNSTVHVDEGTNTVTINTNAGSYQAGGDVTLPSGFPSDVYRIDGTLTAAYTTNETDGYTISLTTSKTMAEAKSLYDQRLVSDGWSVTSSMSYQDNSAIYAEKGNRFVMVGINTNESQVTVTISTYTGTASNTNTWN